MNIQQLLELTINNRASDLHLVVGYPPQLRVDGELVSVSGSTPLTPSEIEALLFSILSPQQKESFSKRWELDCSFEYQNTARFRVNIYHQKGHIAAALRMIPKSIRSLEDTGLPAIAMQLTELKQGLVLVTGPTGHGKSTTIAALINQINMTKNVHVLTIEDPIEFVYPQAKSLISQRELNSDTKTWADALKAALREDPDVVLVGEMRDYETIAAAMTIAETGHLVLATLHTNSASQTIDRIIDVFPEDQQPQIRSQLSSVIEAIISQRLVPTINPGRVMAAELLFGTPALRAIIREGKTHMIDNLIQTSAETGMIGLESALALLVRRGVITSLVAESYALKPQLLNKLLHT